MKEIKREFYERLEKSCDDPVVILMTGIRQSGKTTALRHIKENWQGEFLWVDCDRFDTRNRYKEDPMELIADIEAEIGISLKGFHGRTAVFIDEIQKCPKLFDVVKWIHDQFKKKVKFFLTGSSSVSLHHGASESLAGRVEILKVFPLTIMEALRFDWSDKIVGGNFAKIISSGISEKIYKELTEWSRPFKRRVEKQLPELLLLGFMPALFSIEDQRKKWIYLKNFRETYIERDIRGEVGIKNLSEFSKLMVVLANRISSSYSWDSVGVKIGLDRRTVKKYFSILQATYVLVEILPYFSNIEKKMVKTPKFYFVDNGIRNELAGTFSQRTAEAREEMGKLYEQLVVNEIRKQLAYSEIPHTINFSRNYSGSEVDLVIEAEVGLIPVEIKMGTGKIKGLYDFMEKHSKEIAFGLVIGKDFEKMGEKIYSLPLYAII